MRYVVGYSANARGHDAVNLAVSLARGRGASLDLVLVVPEVQQFGAAHAPKAGFETPPERAGTQWLDEALALVPADVPAQAHIRTGDSDAQALIEAAEELGADVLVIGATSSGLVQAVHHRFGGQRAAPRIDGSGGPGTPRLPPHGGPDPDQLRPRHPGGGRKAARLRHRHGGEPDGPVAGGFPARARRRRPGDAAEAAREYAEKTVAAAAPVNPSGVQLAARTDVVVAQGRSIEEAVDGLDWEDGEVLVIGSSRLAQARSIFLGSTANRILRALPVPMLVVPSGYELKHQNHSTSNDTSGEAPQ